MSVGYRARDAVAWTDGELVAGHENAALTGASIDSRAVPAGALFVAIIGPNHDAHRFLATAVAAGAGGLLVERGQPLPPDLPDRVAVVAVDDTTRALGRLAHGHRSRFSGPVVAITGSNGKTTTKEMCAEILAVGAPCARTLGNLNNQFGLPLTLLRRNDDDASLVVEMGMNHRGEIAELVAIAAPTVGVITNIGTAHIEFLGSREEIALEKGDLVANLPRAATAVLNADDALVSAQAARTRARVLRFGASGDADVRATNPTQAGATGWNIELTTPSGTFAVEIEGLGETTWRNALAAAAGAFAAGASNEQIAEGLARYKGVAGRLAHALLPNGVMVIDDTYNANPQSMEVALRLVADLASRGRSFAVIGDMGELGDQARAAHEQTGKLVGELGIDFLFILGTHAEAVRAGALAAGMAPDNARIAPDAEELAEELSALLEGGDHVVVKGSRSMKMERIVTMLAERASATDARD
jgi:UDP-N-acetylmuramoyl-tripeptide--D-alanyl-D-alanine ligase